MSPAAAPPARDRDKDQEAHKHFDEAVITVAVRSLSSGSSALSFSLLHSSRLTPIVPQAGHGGRGQSRASGKPKTVKNFKYHPGGQQRKFIELAPGLPAAGGAGGDVILYVDPFCESLLHLRDRKTWHAKDGLAGDAALPVIGDRTKGRTAPSVKPLRIPVPPGTVVRRKRGAILLGDLVRPGQQLLVAAGGKGGPGVRPPSAGGGAASGGTSRTVRDSSGEFVLETSTLNDADFDLMNKGDLAAATAGQAGETVTLELLLRVVADVGIVGLPNAGKSSLLAAVTRASPEVAPYPFTTLTPNLGVLNHDPTQPAVLADLPGLIRGAHKGVGLGRAFLRHLRRTRAMVVVADASAADPVGDYLAVREELWLYNPEYCARPHVLALNKIDILSDVASLTAAPPPDLVQQFSSALEEHGGRLGVPTGIFPVSAVTGEGLKPLLDHMRDVINDAAGVDDELQLSPEELAMARGK